MDEVRLAKQSDIELMDLRIKVQGHNDTYRKFSIKGDFLYFNDHLVIPSTGSLNINYLMSFMHQFKWTCWIPSNFPSSSFKLLLEEYED